ncbi:MAG: uroporphyrinogen-III synthase, partial [Methanobacteriaceae archaeon]
MTSNSYSNSYKNKLIAVTRPSDRSKDAIDIIESYGANAFVAPTLELEIAPKKSLSILYNSLEKWDWIIFTSPSSIEAISKYWPNFTNELKQINKNCKIAVIGPKTKEMAISKGFDVEFVPDSYVAEGLLESFKKYNLKGKLIALPRTLDARKILPNGLKEMGADVKVIEAYKSVFPLDTVRIELLIEMILAANDYGSETCDSCCEGFKMDTIDAITFTSPLTVKNLFKVVADNKKDDL